jgi:hypothetical protein
LALIGALLLVLAESRVEGKSLFAGVPSLGMLTFRSFACIVSFFLFFVYAKYKFMVYFSVAESISIPDYKVLYAEYIRVTTDTFLRRIYCSKVTYVIQIQSSYLI